MARRKEIEYVDAISPEDVKYGEIVQLKNRKTYLKVKYNYRDRYIPIYSNQSIFQEDLDGEIIATYSSKDATLIKVAVRT